MDYNFDLQPTLENDLVKIVPIKENDFEKLFEVASDPLIWEQHPNKERYKRDVFLNFFNDAIESKGAFIIYDKNNTVIGSSRFYEYDKKKGIIFIGYTFLARKYWGTDFNKSIKTLMLNHAFKYLDNVHFHIGENNIRSQKATQKLGAIKIGEQDFGISESIRFVYRISKKDWLNKDISNHS
ncbi:MAG: GNAT family N-acetyltransferase [Candidatus Sericytochromatia bacterium]